MSLNIALMKRLDNVLDEIFQDDDRPAIKWFDEMADATSEFLYDNRISGDAIKLTRDYMTWKYSQQKVA